jgi:protein-S-isoprenylcysteine O-methyltransferase Ste14
MARAWTRLGAGPKWALPTVLYFATAISVHYAGYPTFVIRQLPGAVCATASGLLFAVGATAYAWALLNLRTGLRGGRLVTRGPYSLVRHPLYAASILFVLPGVALLSRSWLLLPMPAVAYIGARIFISAEERELHHRFGEAFEEYRKRTNALVPRMWPGRSAYRRGGRGVSECETS